MIHYIKIKNFHSINGDIDNGAENEFIFDLRLNEKVSEEESINFFQSQKKKTDGKGYKISLSQAILGENASGKTNILKAIVFLQFIISGKKEEEQDSLNGFVTFANNKNNTSFQIALEKDNIYFEYEVDFNNKYILKESLKYKDYNLKDESNLKTLIQRETINNKVELSSNQKDLQKELDKMPTMPLYDSYFKFANGYNHNNNLYLKKFYDYFYNNIFFNLYMAGDTNTAIKNKDTFINIWNEYKDTEMKIWAINLFNKMDQNIKDISIEEIMISKDEIENTFKKMNIKMDNNFKIDSTFKAVFNYDYKNNTKFDIVHIYESMGNRKLFDMMPTLYNVLNKGQNNLFIFDELDKSLHPELVIFIVSLFNDKEINRTNSQIIFTSHCYNLINELSRHKITFTAKNKNTSETEIYKLSDVKGSADFTNPYQKYMSGSLGSFPNIKL